MKAPFRLIHIHPSDDLVETLEYLLVEAQEARLIGLCYGAILARRDYFVDCAGEAERNPMFALGITDVLADKLLGRVREGEKAA